MNAPPAAAIAFRLIIVPSRKTPVAVPHPGGQLIAAGLLITVPGQVVPLVTVTVSSVPIESTSAAVLLRVSGSVTPAGVAMVAMLVTLEFPEPAITLTFNRNVALAPTLRLTVVLMLPVPEATPQLAPAPAVQVQLAPVS